MDRTEVAELNALLEEAKALLQEDGGGDVMPGNKEGGTGNAGQEDDKDGDEPADTEELPAAAGDDDHAASDKAEEPTDMGSMIAQALGDGMESARETIKGVVGEAVKNAVHEAYGKGRKKMMKEYSTMPIRSMGELSGKLDEVATKIASDLDVKEMVHSALDTLLRQQD